MTAHPRCQTQGRTACPIPWRGALIALAALGWAALGGATGAPAAWGANPELAAAASLILPGLGQAANGDYAAGAAHLGVALALSAQYDALAAQPDYVAPQDRVDSDNKVVNINRTSFQADVVSTALLDLSFYSSYGAYRDARLARQNAGYNTPAPSESLGDLALAPFRWEYLSRPTTWIVLLAAAYNASQPPAASDYVFNPQGALTRNEMAQGFALEFESVAVGEEAFFRGVLNNSLSSSLGPNWGLVTSSAVFGLAHSGNPGQATTLGASLFGLYLGYLQQADGYRIGQDVAIHFWWDFLTGLAQLQQHSKQAVQLASVELRF